MAAVDKRALPKKEHDLYRSIAKHYETKQYKKGIKAADTVLKKFPDHGETQCMKALCLSCMDKKEEAFELVKSGLRNDMRSHVCWHVHGLIHRGEKDYAQAVKAYKQALKIEPNNMLILRDNSLLQIQLRDFEGFAETRRQILTLKSSQKTNWMAFAVAHHLAGRPGAALDIVDKYIKTLEGSERVKDFDESELMLYKADLLIEVGKLDEALTHLESNQEFVVDAYGLLSKKAELLLLKGDFEQARGMWRDILLDYSTENYGSHRGWQCALLELDNETVKLVLGLKALDLVHTVLGDRLTSEQREVLVDAYKTLAEMRPRSRAVRRIPLTFLEGAAFESAMTRYMEKMIADGVPALGADLSSFYTVRADTLSVDGSMGTSHPQSNSKGSSLLVRCKDPRTIAEHPTFQLVFKIATNIYEKCLQDDTNLFPTTLLWCMYLMSQLEEARGNFDAALSFIDRCIEHTPTAVDMYERRGRLLRKSGDVAGASLQMEIARKLDLADRYINNKSAKYLLRCGERQQALDTVGLFTKHDGAVENNLKDMQVLWFQNECGHAALRSLEMGPALKKFHAVIQIFEDFIDDQFDFHSYCMRRMTLRSYVACLQMSDQLQHHRSYQRAACGAIACYIKIHDDPSLKSPAGSKQGEEVVDFSGMSAAEKKKAKLLARKAKAKQDAEKLKAEEEEKAAAAAAAATAVEEEDNDTDDKNKKKSKFGEPPVPPPDKDPLGHVILEKCDPLNDAAKLVSALVNFSPKAISTHASAFDVACRRQKPLMALQALCRANQINETSAEMIPRLASFLLGVELSGIKGKKAKLGACPSNATPFTRELFTCARATAEACASLEPYAVEVLLAELTQLTKGAAAPSDWLSSVSGLAATSLTHAIAAARATLLLSNLGGKKDVSGLIMVGDLSRPNTTYPNCVEALAVLEETGSDLAQWKTLCTKQYPKSELFGTVVRPISGEHEEVTVDGL